MIAPVNYIGVDKDLESISCAKNEFPDHKFQFELPASDQKFDTIISLAVIEHVTNPTEFLEELSGALNNSADSYMVITTPHPAFDFIHDWGAKVGLFSAHANEEHEELLDKSDLVQVGEAAGLRLVTYKRFLFGVNQLAIYKK